MKYVILLGPALKLFTFPYCSVSSKRYINTDVRAGKREREQEDVDTVTDSRVQEGGVRTYSDVMRGAVDKSVASRPVAVLDIIPLLTYKPK